MRSAVAGALPDPEVYHAAAAAVGPFLRPSPAAASAAAAAAAAAEAPLVFVRAPGPAPTPAPPPRAVPPLPTLGPAKTNPYVVAADTVAANAGTRGARPNPYVVAADTVAANAGTRGARPNPYVVAADTGPARVCATSVQRLAFMAARPSRTAAS